MKLPEKIKIRISSNYFKNYLLNHSHYFGKIKIARLAIDKFDESTLENILSCLKRIPIEHDYLGLKVIYKLGFIYKVEYVTTMSFDTNKFYVKTIWIHEEKAKIVKLLNIQFIY